MRNFINLVEGADPDSKNSIYHRGSSHYAPDLWEREGFANWFKGSQVIGPTGNPLIAFHGSFEQFSEFRFQSDRRRSYGFNRLGFWFDVDPTTPEYFAGYENGIAKGTHGGVMPCVLSIKKPLYLDSEFLYRDDAEELEQKQTLYRAASLLHMNSHRDSLGNIVGRDGKSLRLPDGRLLTPKLYKEINDDYSNAKNKMINLAGGSSNRDDAFTHLMKLLPRGARSSDKEVDEFRQELESHGYDGIYLSDTAADFESRNFTSTDWWIAFRPNQIKSIFAKSFTDSPNIMQ